MENHRTGLASSLRLALARYRRRRLRARTERLLAELPQSVLKDIGWPDTQPWNDDV